MRKLIAAAGFAALVFADFSALSVTMAEPANAVVCARGWRGAGCVGPRGAVGVRHYGLYRRGPVRVYRRW
jgi:hypothetical protein